MCSYKLDFYEIYYYMCYWNVISENEDSVECNVPQQLENIIILKSLISPIERGISKVMSLL